jgi:hypothetical protein
MCFLHHSSGFKYGVSRRHLRAHRGLTEDEGERVGGPLHNSASTLIG